MKLRFVLLPFILALALVLSWNSGTLAIVHGSVFMERQKADSISKPPLIDFDIVFHVPENFRNLIPGTLENFGYSLFNTPKLAVSAMEDYGSWVHFSLIPSEVIESGWQTSFRPEDIVEIVFIKEQNGNWTGYVVNAETLPTLAKLLPTYFDHRLQGPEAEAYLFPWTSPQEWYKTQGWHSGYTSNAIDFVPVVQTDPSVHFAVLGSKSGSVIQVCNDGYQKVLRIDHSDASTYYLHLDANTVPDCIINASVARGQFLGQIYNGAAFVNGACGAAPSLQYNTACGCGTGPHLHFETTNRSITIDGYPINNVANSPNYTKYQSSNVRTDGCSGCCGCLPVSCCGSTSAAFGSSVPSLLLNDGSMNITTPMQAIDLAGNANETVHLGPSLIDAEPPEFAIDAQSQRIWSNKPQAPAFSWPAAKDDSALAGYRIYWGEDKEGTGDRFVTDVSFTPDEALTLGQPTVRYLRVAAEDTAGNQSGWQTVAVWHYDPTAPTGSLTVANGSPTVRSLNVRLNLDATDEGSFVSHMRFSSDGVNWTEWEPYARRKSWQLANTNEPQTIFAQVQDEAGNVSETMATSITAALNVGLPSSPNYSIARSTFSMGGADKSSVSYQVRGTIGQGYQTGHVQSSSYQVNSGYWAGVCALEGFSTPPSITSDGSSIILSWAAAPGATIYNIYRATTPYFTPATPYATTSNTTWTEPDPAAIGDTDVNYFYIVRPANNCGESADAHRMGEFDFDIVAGD